MKDFDFSALSPRKFQQLVQALALKVFGHLLVPMGDGADGGRDATYHGRVEPADSRQPWNGYLIVQVKHRQNPTNDATDANLVCTHLGRDLALLGASSNGISRPDYYIVATNVRLSPVPPSETHSKHGKRAQRTGGRAKVEAVLDRSRADLNVPFKDYDIWDYTKIATLLADYPGIRQTYLGEITTGDILTKIWQSIGDTSPDLAKVLPRFIRAELQADVDVPLERAGHHTGSGHRQVRLSEVYMDLPLLANRRASWQYRSAQPPSIEATAYFSQLDQPDPKEEHDDTIGTAETAEDVEDISTVAEDSSDPSPPTKPRASQRYVLVGGPGQGKTSVGRFLAQLYRAKAVSGDKDAEKSQEITDIVGELRLRCVEDDIPFPAYVRLPFRVELPRFAKDLAEGKVGSLIEYFVSRIRTRTGDTVMAGALREELKQHAWIIILDGLDEVPITSNRGQVLEAISDFIVQAGGEPDLRIVVTTRPQGYGHALDRRYYQHLYLAPLGPENAIKYANRLIRVRYSDVERQNHILSLFEKAAKDPATNRLMGTPLHVTIMIALLEQGGLLPKDRWRLFERYYEVIYTREQGAGNENGPILQENKDVIDNVHKYAGLLLQVRSENVGGTDARISVDNLRQLVVFLIKSEFGSNPVSAGLEGELLRIATDRLVFLAGDESATTVGFDITSLREYMAGMALFTGTDEQVLSRLNRVIPMPHWRNVALFTVGKCFSQLQRLRQPIINLCAGLNTFPTADYKVNCPLRLRAQCHAYLKVGSRFALDLLEERIASSPEARAKLTRIALETLDVQSPDNRFQLVDRITALYRTEELQLYLAALATRLNSVDLAANPSNKAWRLVLSLAHNGETWAEELAKGYLPENPEVRFRLLRQAPNSGLFSPWIIEEYERLAGRVVPCPIRRPVRGTEEVIEQRLAEHPRLRALFVNLMPPLSISLRTTRTQSVPIEIHVMPVFAMKNPLASLLLEVDAPSLGLIYDLARFIENPCRGTLGRLLRAISVADDVEPWVRLWAKRPWIVAACMACAGDRGGLSGVASDVEAGLFGSEIDWKTAEQALLSRAVTIDDLLSWANLKQFGFEQLLHGSLLLLRHGVLLRRPGREYGRDEPEWPMLFRKLLEVLPSISTGLGRSVLVNFLARNMNRVIRLNEDVQAPLISIEAARIFVQEQRRSARPAPSVIQLLTWVDPGVWDDPAFIDDLDAVFRKMDGVSVYARHQPPMEHLLEVLTRDGGRWGIASLVALSAMEPAAVTRVAQIAPLLSPENSQEEAIAALLKLRAGIWGWDEVPGLVSSILDNGMGKPLIERLLTDRDGLTFKDHQALAGFVIDVCMKRNTLDDPIQSGMEDLLEREQSNLGRLEVSPELGLPDKICELICSVCEDEESLMM